MPSNLKELANPAIANLIPYQPGKPIDELARELGISDIIKLASNENPLGPSPLAMQAAQQAIKNMHIYPDGSGFILKQALAKSLNMATNQITLGNGSENIFEIIVKAYLTPNDSAVVSQYSFATISIVVQAIGAKLNIAPAVNYGHDINNMLAAIDNQTRLLFIVNPNNPTGTYTTESEFLRLMDSVPSHIIVVADEAYFEYMDRRDYPNTLKLLDKYPNLIISRTFSKVHGLAGIRVGYAISHPDVADMLNRARLPFNVNSIALVAATAALSDHEHMRKTVALNQQGLKQFEQGLKELDIEYIPSVANFVSIDMKRDALPVYQALLQQGVIVRPLKAYGMPTHLRVTTGNYEENARFLTALQQCMVV